VDVFQKVGGQTTGEARSADGKWTINIRGVAAVAIAYVLVITLLALLRRSAGNTAGWPIVTGTIEETRIVADHAWETGWGGELTWKAEFKVAYFVDANEYSTWVDSRIRGESEGAVRLALPKWRPSCSVKCNLKNPGQAIGNCN
jgi:hypothetical protein